MLKMMMRNTVWTKHVDIRGQLETLVQTENSSLRFLFHPGEFTPELDGKVESDLDSLLKDGLEATSQ